MRSLGELRREAARCVQAHVRGWLTRCRMLHWKDANRKSRGILHPFGSSSAARDERISSYRRLESGELPNAYATPGGRPHQDSAPGSSNANPGGKGVAPPPSHSYANALRGARRRAHSLPNPFKAATHLAAVEADRMLERRVEKILDSVGNTLRDTLKKPGMPAPMERLIDRGHALLWYDIEMELTEGIKVAYGFEHKEFNKLKIENWPTRPPHFWPRRSWYPWPARWLCAKFLYSMQPGDTSSCSPCRAPPPQSPPPLPAT